MSKGKPDQFDGTINKWIKCLETYDEVVLCKQPTVGDWSLGQVYEHLVEETFWYFEQIEVCLKSGENSEKRPTETIQVWFKNGSFSDERFEGPPGLPVPPQPISKEDLRRKLISLRKKMNALGHEISQNRPVGKAQHPGHGFLNAEEWFQYAEMHMRHHFRQKERIDLQLS